MSSMDKKRLSAADICRIIKQCQGTGISKLSIGDLTLEFNSQGKESASLPGQAIDHNPTVETNQTIENFDKELLEEASLAQVMIDDPLAYEKLQISQDIERERQLT
jgi:hypothetical protein